MAEIIEAAGNLNIPMILVLVGLFLIILSLVGRISANIAIPDKLRNRTVWTGTVILAIGLIFYFFEFTILSPDGRSSVSQGTPETRTTTPAPVVREPVETANPDQKIWLLQFGNYLSENNAIGRKQVLESKGLTGLQVVKSGDYPKLDKPGYYVVYGPVKQSETRAYVEKYITSADTGLIHGTDYYEKPGY